MLKNLVEGEWWTQNEVKTDAEGYVEVEGFKGDSVLEMEGKSAALRLQADSKQQKITMK